MKEYDVIGIGSALLDITFEVDDDLLKELGLKKGQMILINNEQNLEILKKLNIHQSKIYPGGSASNTIAGIGLLGGKTVFLGKIGKDDNGKIYEIKTKDSNVEPYFIEDLNEITGNTITFITPDYERTFTVNLGASNFLNKEDINEEILKKAKILHLEGYLMQTEKLKEVLLYIIELAKKNNLKISIDLCDAGLIKNNLEFLKKLIKENIDIVFLNEDESLAFAGKKPEDSLTELSNMCETAIVKLGKKGSLIYHKNKIYNIPGYSAQIINTNGAGDMYAAGILYGLANDLEIEKTGNLASYAASLVVSSPGARLEKDLIRYLNNFKSEIGA